MPERKKLSENAKAVAIEVQNKVSKGEKVIMGEIARKHGYSKGISKQPIRIRNTQTYQDEIKPFLDRITRERDRLIREAESRNLTQEEYKILIDSVDKLTKNIELLSGRATERKEEQLSEEQINEIISRRATQNNPSGPI